MQNYTFLNNYDFLMRDYELLVHYFMNNLYKIDFKNNVQIIDLIKN